MKKSENFNFHLSLPCKNIVETKQFYVQELGFEIGRKQGYVWFDVNIFGNQVTFNHDDTFGLTIKSYNFEDCELPTFHFGVIVDKTVWEELNAKFRVVGQKTFSSSCLSILTCV